MWRPQSLPMRFGRITALALTPTAIAIFVALFSDPNETSPPNQFWLWFALVSLVMGAALVWHWLKSSVSDPINKIAAYVQSGGDVAALSRDASEFAAPELRQIATAVLRTDHSGELNAASLQRAVDQRDAALREMFHRVRNNLQLTSSFIGLQWRQARDESAKASLGKSKAYLTFMAAAHQALYTSGDLTRVSIPLLTEQYIKIVTSAFDQISVLSVDTRHVSDRAIAPDRAVPLSLCLCEGLGVCVQSLGADRTYTSALLVSSDNGEYIWRIDVSAETAQPIVDRASLKQRSIPPAADLLMPSFIAQLQGRVTAWPEASSEAATFEVRFPRE